MILAMAALLAGGALILGGLFAARQDQAREIDELLGLTAAVVPEEVEAEVSGLAGRAVELASDAVDRVDGGRSLADALDRARIHMRPGEFVIVTTAAALGLAAALFAATHSPVVGASGMVGGALGSWWLVRRRIRRRRRALERQLPGALSLVASSLAAGHTFLRAIQMMCEESDPPLSEEFDRVVTETRLGGPVVDALERMAVRLAIRDLDMVVQAIRVQQTVGGRLSDLLHTLADFIRAREEVRREVQVLTAEGRVSAYVLAGLVPFLFMMIQVTNPPYLKPMFSGWGLVALGLSGLSVVGGTLVILHMVKIDV